MKTTDEIIDEILLKSPYGAKSYEDRKKRQRENEASAVTIDDVIVDHPQQIYINFEEKNNG